MSVAGESLELIEGDARGYPIWNLESRPRKIIANLPYNVATNLFLSWLEHSSAFESMTLMFQREVAERLVAKTGCSEYGRLSVLTQFLADSEILFDVPATAFVPPPKVTSSLVKIIPLPTPRYTCNQRTLELITSLAFGQRRKMLRGSLKSIGGEFLLQRANIDPKKRPQDLSVRDFCNLAKTYDS